MALLFIILNRILLIYNVFLFLVCVAAGNLLFAALSLIVGYVNYVGLKNLP